MAQPAIQASFNSGEWAPALTARVDQEKYHSAAALLRNFFVDYRGGASTRPGTRYIVQCRNSTKAVRLIPFQASFNVGYILEFGDQYIRFIYQGAPVLEATFAITGITQASPGVFTIPGNNYVVGDWVYVTGVNGMTQVNGKYLIVVSVSGSAVSFVDLYGAGFTTAAFSAYTSGGTIGRIYTLTTPYLAADLAKIKFAQNVNQMVLTHPSYVPQTLNLITYNNWILSPITFGVPSTNTPVAPTVVTTLAGGSVNYSYVVTSIDSSGQESPASVSGSLLSKADLRVSNGTNKITWPAVSGAVSYNVYKSNVSYYGPVPVGATYGFIGNLTGLELDDSNISADYTQTPPIASNPFGGSGVASVNVTASGTYTAVPNVSFTGAAQVSASGQVTLGAKAAAISAAGAGYAAGDVVTFTNFVQLIVTSISSTPAAGTVTGLSIPGTTGFTGSVTSGSTPTNPVPQVSTTGAGSGLTVNLTWGVSGVTINQTGQGYSTAPSVVFSGGTGSGASGTAVLGATSAGNPAVCGFFQQRLVLAGATGAPETLNFSQPGSYFNFNVTSPVSASDAISATLASGQLNTIKSVIPQSAGLIILTDKASFLINGGSTGSAISPSAIVANAQSYNGASDVPPIVSNYDILYVQSKGSIVRDSTYNFYANVFTGTDISVLASHLFYGHTIKEWAFAEEPFKVIWAVRDDGIILTLTFVKEQEFIGWSHSDTQGLYQSVAAVTETTANAGNVDAIYTVVQRTVNGKTLQYIERNAERIFPNGRADAWSVDSALQYIGGAATNFRGGEHLAGMLVTGVADGGVIAPFVMPSSGAFTLPAAASKVTVGLAFTAQLQTMRLDTGNPTIQSKRKKIAAVTARVNDTLGLKIGSSFSALVVMKDLVLGNVGSMTNALVSNLVAGDARTLLDPSYNSDGQYCFQQDLPLPATILGVMPEYVEGDTK